MSTRSNIAIKRKDESIDSIYCHSDGYLEYNGVILNHYYKNPKKVNELIELGDISCLGKHINPDPSIEHSFDKRQNDTVVAYHRDRNENNVNKRHYNNMEEYKNHFRDSWEEFAYLYDEKTNEWSYALVPYDNQDEMEFEPLLDKLKDMNKVYEVDDKIDKVVNQIIDYHKLKDLYNYNDNYESDEDAYYDFERVVSYEDGLINTIDILSLDMAGLAKYEDLKDPEIAKLYTAGNELIYDLNDLMQDLNKDKNDEIEM